MERLIGLLHTVARDNTDNVLNCFFYDPRYGVALAGYRRLYGCGDCLVRIKAEDIDMGRLDRVPGNYLYQTEEYVVEHGLPGKELPNGTREVVDAEKAEQKFGAVMSQVAEADNTFTVLLNPKMICEFIEERTSSAGFADKKINIQIFEGVNYLGEVAARIGSENGQVFAELKVGFNQYDRAYIDEEQSRIPTNRLKDGKMYIVSGTKRTEDGTRFVRVIRDYKPGIRFAIQHFRNGLLLPNSPARYSVLDGSEYNIGMPDIKDVPFIRLPEFRQGNRAGNFLKAPMLHIDLDTFYRALKPMERFPVAAMHFKDSITGIYIESLSGPGEMKIEAIIGPTSPYKSGKVYTA